MELQGNRNYSIEDLENLLDNIPYEIWIKGEDKKYKYVNKATCDRIGKSRENILGQTDHEINEQSIAEIFLKTDIQAMQNKNGILLEEVFDFNGEDIWREVYKTSFRKIDENFKFIGGIAKEITIDRNLQNSIQKSSQNFLNNKDEDDFGYINRTSNLINNLAKRLRAQAIDLFVYDENINALKLYSKTGKKIEYLNNNILYINSEIKNDLIITSKYEKIMNYNYFKSHFKYNTDINQGYARIFTIKYGDQLIGTLNIYYEEKRINQYVQVDFIRRTCEKLGLIIRNIELSKKLNKELKRRIDSEKELELFLDTAIDLYALSKIDGNFIKVNEKWYEIFGWSEEEIKGLKIYDIIHPDDLKSSYEIIKKGRIKGYVKHLINRCKCKNGKYKVIEWSWSYIFDKKIAVLTGKDITDKIKLQQDNKNLELAVELESIKIEFFANISHDFKTPLNIILTTTQLILKNLKDDNIINSNNIYKYIKGIQQNSYRLLRLVNNIIDINKIDVGHYKLRLGNYNIVNIVEDVVSSVVDYIGNKGINIIFDTSDEEIIIACDPEKIERVILNLLSNSIKYTDEYGNIEVKINTDNENVVISVKNDGEPIPIEDVKKIFIRFSQSEKLLTKCREGSGIGLSLVKSLIEMHKGKIWVNTELKDGAEFIFTLPIKKIKNELLNDINNKNISSKIEKCNIEFSDIYS